MLARLVQRVCGIAGPTLTRHAWSALPRTRRVARVAGVTVGAPAERQSTAPQLEVGSDVAKPKAGECKSGCKFGAVRARVARPSLSRTSRASLIRLNLIKSTLKRAPELTHETHVVPTFDPRRLRAVLSIERRVAS